MRKYLSYFRTVLRHKRLVLQAGRERGVPIWRLVVHDWSKFLPWEFVPYAEWFDGRSPAGHPWYEVYKRARQLEGQRDPNDEERAVFQAARDRHRAFMQAFLYHLHLNPHHHQYWRLPSHGDKPGQVFEMPEVYVREMLADWDGAGRAYQGADADTRRWYESQTDIVLGLETRALVERLL